MSIPIPNRTIDLKGAYDIFDKITVNSPIIVVLCVLFFASCECAYTKFGIYFCWVLFLTILRRFFVPNVPRNPKCPPQLLIDYDVTYSTFILCFTLMYFIAPMALLSYETNTSQINYCVLAFFIAFILLDLFMKVSNNCVTSIFSQLVIINIIMGFGLGILVAGVAMYALMRNQLFTNQLNSNGEICTMQKNTKFTCNVYKNGEIVGSTTA
jgi:hypothetical protein